MTKNMSGIIVPNKIKLLNAFKINILLKHANNNPAFYVIHFRVEFDNYYNLLLNYLIINIEYYKLYYNNKQGVTERQHYENYMNNK